MQVRMSTLHWHNGPLNMTINNALRIYNMSDAVRAMKQLIEPMCMTQQGMRDAFTVGCRCA